MCRSYWPRGLRHRSATACLLGSWVPIPPRAWIFVCCECCVLSGRGLCDGLITRPEKSCRLWCVVTETSSRMRRPWLALGCSAIGGTILNVLHGFFIRRVSYCYVWAKIMVLHINSLWRIMDHQHYHLYFYVFKAKFYIRYLKIFPYFRYHLNRTWIHYVCLS